MVHAPDDVLTYAACERSIKTPTSSPLEGVPTHASAAHTEHTRAHHTTDFQLHRRTIIRQEKWVLDSETIHTKLQYGYW